MGKADSSIQGSLNMGAVVSPGDLWRGHTLELARQVERPVDVNARLAHDVHNQGLHCKTGSQPHETSESWQ